MELLQKLVLRNLSISGELPDYIGGMKNLQRLDLSFNNLTGPIPSSFEKLSSSIDHMYLTNNMLNGTIPDWILTSKQSLDLSYNYFTGSLPSVSCQQMSPNFASSYYSPTDSDSIKSCLRRNIPCSGEAKYFNLFINCGGKIVTIGDNEYEEDTSLSGPSTFETSESGKWAYSSTGEFMDNDYTPYITSNASLLNMSNPELYMTAHLNPLSLRYYGLCLQKGNYSVILHFAEIMFTNDETYSSVGRRLFDVYVQGEKVLTDFDISKEANGAGQEIIKNFTTIVDGSTLEIHFRWSGKGTNAIPRRSVYGPLISAISVTPNFKPDTGDSKLPDTGGNKLSWVLLLLLLLVWQ